MNIDPLLGTLIAEGKASLYELKMVYSWEDAFLIYEALAVKAYNEYVIRKRYMKDTA